MVPNLMAEMAEQGAVRLGQLRPARSISALSASASAIVITPSSWPVITFGPEGSGGSARNSNIKPWLGFSARVSSGNFQRSRL